MSQREDGPDEKDPAPLEHSDAERISGDEAPDASDRVEDESADEDEKD